LRITADGLVTTGLAADLAMIGFGGFAAELVIAGVGFAAAGLVSAGLASAGLADADLANVGPVEDVAAMPTPGASSSVLTQTKHHARIVCPTPQDAMSGAPVHLAAREEVNRWMLMIVKRPHYFAIVVNGSFGCVPRGRSP
jgi:hypothetical protein